MALRPGDPAGQPAAAPILEAVTKDQLNTGLTGQIRYRVSRAQPLRLPVRREEPDRPRDGLLRLGAARAHRQLRGAAGARRRRRAPADRCDAAVTGISINDLRKNLRDLNEHMDQRVPLVGRALRHGARRLADHRHRPAAGGRVGAGGHQHRAQPGVVATSAWRRRRADQKIVQSQRAVEIETLKAQAEVEPLMRAGRAACGD